MYIFICDAVSDRSFIKKNLHNFYSDVLSNMNSDSMTPKQIDKELKLRQVARMFDSGAMILIFKKF